MHKLSVLRRRCIGQVEASFYDDLAADVLSATGSAIPAPLHVASHSLGAPGGSLTLLMTDLRGRFPRRVGSLGLGEARTALRWLATFHAHFWGKPAPPGVWPEGCYWHLDTR